MNKDSKITLVAVGVLAVAYFYFRKKRNASTNTDESEETFSNASYCSASDLSTLQNMCDEDALPDETATIVACRRKRSGKVIGTCRFDSDNGGVRYSEVDTSRGKRVRRNVASSFSNASGCSSQDLSDLMDTCNSMDEAQGASSIGIRSCKVKRNGTRVGRCKFEYSNGNVIVRDVTVGGRKRVNRNLASSFSGGW